MAQKKSRQSPRRKFGKLPGYSQYPGACGLTSLLMALRPEERGIAPVLDEICENNRDICHAATREKNWQQALEYVLVGISRKPELQRALEGHVENLDEKLILLKYKMANTGVPERGKISEHQLVNRVNVWKDDYELELLSSLFGCDKVPYAKDPMGGGAIYFAPGERSEEKVQLMKCGRGEAGDPLLCCAGVHWLAVEDVKDADGGTIVKYNDPAGGYPGERTLSSFGESSRFHAFKCSPARMRRNIGLIRRLFGKKLASPSRQTKGQ